jgi:uncharacterized membrane protein YeiH
MHRNGVTVLANRDTISGTGIALAQETPLVIAILMGVLTGTMGGVLRDVVVNEIPDLFRPGGLYATASFAGALVFILALQVDFRYTYAAAFGVAIVILLRLLSIRLGVGMPPPQWATDRSEPDR